jgi:LmbE family N-acetylglucosaminyl deacetylase
VSNQPDDWSTRQKILVILSHPDDPEFFCGATLARWALSGHELHYRLLTCGEKGGNVNVPPSELCRIRIVEQQKAANIIGVKSIQFLDELDGCIMPSLELRRKIVRIIRTERPDILVTCDPTFLYTPQGTLNHPDHRATGQVVLDAVFPAAGNSHYFPELLEKDGLEPYTPREIWVSLACQPTVIFDVTDMWETKLLAIKEHRSQIGDPAAFEQRMRSRRANGSTEEHPRYEERFRVIRYS